MRPIYVLAAFFSIFLVMYVVIYVDYELWLAPAMSTASPFLNFGNFLFVLIPSFGLAMLVYSPYRVGRALKLGVQSFFKAPLKITQLSQKIVQLAALSRSDGIMALEKLAVGDDFLQHGINLTLKGGTEEKILATMHLDLQANIYVLKQAARIIYLLMLTAPLFGFIATLIAVVYENPIIVQMPLGTLLLPTLYGFIMAGCFFAPLYYRLKEEVKRQERYGQFKLLGLKCIIQGEHPSVVQEKLIAFLSSLPKPTPKQKLSNNHAK